MLPPKQIHGYERNSVLKLGGHDEALPGHRHVVGIADRDNVGYIPPYLLPEWEEVAQGRVLPEPGPASPGHFGDEAHGL